MHTGWDDVVTWFPDIELVAHIIILALSPGVRLVEALQPAVLDMLVGVNIRWEVGTEVWSLSFAVTASGTVVSIVGMFDAATLLLMLVGAPAIATFVLLLGIVDQSKSQCGRVCNNSLLHYYLLPELLDARLHARVVNLCLLELGHNICHHVILIGVGVAGHAGHCVGAVHARPDPTHNSGCPVLDADLCVPPVEHLT